MNRLFRKGIQENSAAQIIQITPWLGRNPLLTFGGRFFSFVDGAVKHVNLPGMKTITVRDLRQRWPQAEAALAVEEEILITRDSKPVAKLVRLADEPKRPRWDPAEHARWQRRISRGQISRSDEGLQQARADRLEKK
jgi:antitoxin (DNA-binding transcriptional repressor) of toxin-antitoxin stability system